MPPVIRSKTPTFELLIAAHQYKGVEKLLDILFEPVWVELDIFRKSIISIHFKLNPDKVAHIHYKNIQITTLADFFKNTRDTVKHRIPIDIDKSLVPQVELFLYMRDNIQKDYLSFKTHFIQMNPNADIDRNHLRNIREANASKLLKSYIKGNSKLLDTYYFYYTKMVARNENK